MMSRFEERVSSPTVHKPSPHTSRASETHSCASAVHAAPRASPNHGGRRDAKHEHTHPLHDIPVGCFTPRDGSRQKERRAQEEGSA
jgi:hypothetical protein